jgi:IclR family KDG regulon transcriptional repressor
VVVLENGYEAEDALAKDIMGFTQGRIAGYKRPKSVDFKRKRRCRGPQRGKYYIGCSRANTPQTPFPEQKRISTWRTRIDLTVREFLLYMRKRRYGETSDIEVVITTPCTVPSLKTRDLKHEIITGTQEILEIDMNKSFGSLEKAIQILSLFDSGTPELSAQEISKALSIPSSTTYNYLKVFLQNEILSKNKKTNKFCLGFRMFKLGILAAENISLLEIVRPYLVSIAARSMETAVLTVIDGMDVLCVDTVESPRLSKLTMKKGVRLPLHAGAASKVLLAYQDPFFIQEMIEQKRLVKLNRNTITDPEELERELKTIRAQGLSLSHSEVDPGAAALSVPIFDHKGRVIASLSLIGPTEAIFREDKQILIDMLRDASGKISSELGYVQ